ncbi:MAG: hypothetical protein B7Y39_11935 [Bdellovibrio sp. 28-41-41]|nr:MAG: hypothetical protein B7Y39_11935 [Bdellovibrio sp. 28-41-41]
MFRRSSVIALIFCLSTSVLHANEGGGEHGGAPAAAAAPEKIPLEEKQQQERTKEWMDVVTSLSSLKAKIKSKEDTIKEIIHHKNSAKSKAEAEALVGELLREHKELTKLLEDYNQSAQLLKYRYPDVGITEKRKYEKIDIKSIDDYEDAQTIEGQVKKTVAKVKTHYGVKDEKKPAAEEMKKPSIDNNNLAQPKILKK